MIPIGKGIYVHMFVVFGYKLLSQLWVTKMTLERKSSLTGMK
jgi:hypothetical protein